MNKMYFSLNFMHCMERFATQIYCTQIASFNSGAFAQQLRDASENEREHVQKLHAQIKKLNARVYPFGFLFQFVGVILGTVTRLSGKSNLFSANIFVETRAVRDYNSFLKSIPFDSHTVEVIKGIIKDEELHIVNWKKARESLLKAKTPGT